MDSLSNSTNARVIMGAFMCECVCGVCVSNTAAFVYAHGHSVKHMTSHRAQMPCIWSLSGETVRTVCATIVKSKLGWNMMDQI